MNYYNEIIITMKNKLFGLEQMHALKYYFHIIFKERSFSCAVVKKKKKKGKIEANKRAISL